MHYQIFCWENKKDCDNYVHVFLKLFLFITISIMVKTQYVALILDQVSVVVFSYL